MNLYENIKSNLKNLKEAEEPNVDKKLSFKERVLRAYDNCNYSVRSDMPTIKDIIDYLDLSNDSETRDKVSKIIYKAGKDWQVESCNESEDLGDINSLAKRMVALDKKYSPYTGYTPSDEEMFDNNLSHLTDGDDLSELTVWYINEIIANDDAPEEDKKEANEILDAIEAIAKEKGFTESEENAGKITADEFLEQTIDVYDIADLIENLDIKGAEKGEYTAHLGQQRALIPTKDGKYILADYEAVRDIADTEDDTVAIDVSKKPAPDSKTFPIFPTGTIDVSIKYIKENAPVKQMKAKDFFTKHNYNDRCASNFSGLIGNINGIYYK